MHNSDNSDLNRHPRRTWIASAFSSTAAGACALVHAATARAHDGDPTQTSDDQSPAAPLANTKIRYCLNTSTIREQKLSLSEEIQLAAEAGYDGIEPWMRELTATVEGGQSTRELRQHLADTGLTVDSAIGFARWIVDDPTERRKGVEAMKRDMGLLREIGGTRIAAPPVGATDQTDLDLRAAGERYAAILELGASMDVRPQLEIWGFSKSLSRLSELLYVAAESGRDDVLLLPDVYHLFKGGSDFRSLQLVPGSIVEVMHLNDYPGNIAAADMADKDRVYPGDGAGPLPEIIRRLRHNGFAGTFSLELFNPAYWQQPAATVARTGLAKMKAVVAASDAEPG